MKKLIGIIALIVFLFSVGMVKAETGTVTGSIVADLVVGGYLRASVYKITWTSTAGGAAESTLNDEVGRYANGIIVRVITDPSATAPTDNYDIVLTDATGIDVMNGQLANRDTANTESAVPLVDNVDAIYGQAYAFGNLTITVSNAGDSKIGDIYIIIEYPRYK